MRNLSVLLTDEKDEATQKLAFALSANKMDVKLCAKNGAEIIRVFEESHPDVIIMDAFLQHIDAIGVIKRINETDPVKRPLLIIMSGIDNPNFEREFTKAGIDYFFLKPIEPKSMAERIAQISSWAGANGSARFETEEDLYVVITKALHEVGVPAHVSGYSYVREAIKLSIEDPEMLKAVTKVLYPTVGKHFGSTAPRVERAIRHAIELGWGRADIEKLNEYFGYTIQSDRGKPTNSEFIAMISDRIRLERKRA
ncbi:MAG: sporulation transcription factor Spo0A [Clostridia bacterium]|nr:sporulation transcription factor Spo0A [Clostridia bacterium]